VLFSDLILRKMTEGSLRTDPRASDMASTPETPAVSVERSLLSIWALFASAIAQLVEHVIRNDGVTGSSPVCGTISPPGQVRWNADASSVAGSRR
jgi:hypothetical protein